MEEIEFPEPMVDIEYHEDGSETVHETPCPVCTFGEPTQHTCDEGQQARHAIAQRSPYDYI